MEQIELRQTVIMEALKNINNFSTVLTQLIRNKFGLSIEEFQELYAKEEAEIIANIEAQSKGPKVEVDASPEE